MPYLSDAEFRRRHREWISSPEWKAFREKARAHHKAPRNYHCDHRLYWKNGQLIFGHETFDDVRFLPPRLHGKGIHSDFMIRQDEKAMFWLDLAGV